MGIQSLRGTLRCATVLVSAVGAALTLAPGSAQAQAVLMEGTPLGRIVLGTGGQDSVAIDTPQAVSVMTGDEIERRLPTTMGDVFDAVPGVQAIGSSRVGGESFNIRGIGELSAADESRIIINVDGATKFYEQYRMGSFFGDPALYRQVEVLRGPASATLYGSGALGGVINFETRDAGDFLTTGTQALRTRLTWGSNADEALASVIYATRPSDSFETLVALNYRTAGNYTTGDGTEIPGSEFSSTSGLVKSSFYFGEGDQQALTLSYTRWDSSLDDTQYSQTGTIDAFGTVDRDIVDDTLTLRYQNPVAGSPLFDLDVVLSYSNTEVSQGAASGGCSPFVTLFCASDYTYETTSLRIENTAQFGGTGWEAYVTAGVQLAHQDRLAQSTFGDIGFHPEGTDDRTGVYIQGEFVLADRLTIIPGVRADFVTLEAGDSLGFEGFEDTAISPKLAMLYRVNDGLNLFGSVAQTERVPTIDEIFSTDADEPNSPDLRAETALSAELGIGAFYDNVVSENDLFEMKATLFWSDIEDLIARDSTADTPYYRNVDDATIYGLEIEAAYEADRFFARAAYADIVGEDAATGETLASIPARSLDLTLGARNAVLGLEYGWQGHLVDDISYGDTAADTYAAYAVHDLFVDWAPQEGALAGFEVGLRVDNVLDAEYRNSLAGDPGQGRSFGVSLTRAYEF